MKRLQLFLMIALTFFISCGDHKDGMSYPAREDGGEVLDIPLTGSLQNPAFSPDDTSIVFTRFVNGYNRGPAELYVYHFISKKLHLLVQDGSENVNAPGSSWVGDNIVFSSSRSPHDEIYIISSEGQPGSERKITDREHRMAYEPVFSPDGTHIAFETHPLDVEGEGVITTLKSDGTGTYRALTPSSQDCRQPNWAPDGMHVLYQRNLGGFWSVWQVQTDGRAAERLTQASMGSCTDASFSSDGSFIVYSSDLNADVANIYKMPVKGQIPVRLSYYKGYDGAPSLSHNGKLLVFESASVDPDGTDGTKLILREL